MPISIRMNHYGPPSVLTPFETSPPEPGPDDVVIATVASAVNRADVEIRSGNWKIQTAQPFPYVPGIEACGKIYAVGENVTLPIGAPVITMMQQLGGIHGVRDGGYQTLVRVPADTVVVLPASVDLVAIATVGLAGVTAHHGVEKLAPQKNDRVIVTGASGGVGSMAIALLKARGAFVITPTARSEKSAALRGMGSDEVWDLRQKSYADRSSEKVDAVFEMVGGETFRACVGLLRRGGRLCSVGALTGGDATLSIWDLLHDLTITGWSSENMGRESLDAAVNHLADLLARGTLVPPPVHFFPLTEAARAHAAMEAGEFAGRLLLRP